jgi:hypothetical protein
MTINTSKLNSFLSCSMGFNDVIKKRKMIRECDSKQVSDKVL